MVVTGSAWKIDVIAIPLRIVGLVVAADTAQQRLAVGPDQVAQAEQRHGAESG